MKVLIDMNLSPEWCPYLQSRGFDAVHWSTLGSASAPDSLIFAHAHQHGFVILTLDLDFSSLLAHTRADGPSVIQLRADDAAPDRLGPIVVATMKEHRAALLAGALLSIDLHRARVRLLPFPRGG